MANQKKPFFRHHVRAHRDEKLAKLSMEQLGQWWTIVELCAERILDNGLDFQKEIIFNRKQLALTLKIKPFKLLSLLDYLQDIALLSFKHSENDSGTLVEHSENDSGTLVEHSENDSGTLVEHSENDINLCIANLAKYLGLKDGSGPNRIEENRIEENKLKKNKLKKNRKNPLPPKKDFEVFHLIGNLWNENCGNLPKTKSTSGTRKNKCDKLLKDFPDPKYWINIIKKIAESDFCNGKNDREWVGTFDWLLKPDTNIKVSEGKYDNKVSSKQLLGEKILSGEI